MTRQRRVWGAVAIALTLTALTGCGLQLQDGSPPKNPSPREHYTFEQKLPNGGTVLCVWAKEFSAGGLSCDFANASKK